MERAAAGGLSDLLAAAKPVGNQQGAIGSFPNGGQETPLADGHRQLVVFAPLEAECAGHATATGLGLGRVEADRSQSSFLGGHPYGRLLVAVAVQDSLAGEATRQGGVELVRMSLYEGAKADGQFIEPLGPRIAGEQVRKLIVEDGLARWLQDDHRHPRVEFRLERVEHLAEQSACLLEEAAVVERTATTQVCPWHLDREPGGLENPQRRQPL